LYEDGRYATPDAKAHFAVVKAGRAAHFASSGRSGSTAVTFAVSTRRGKQFNSMIQREVDPLTGARRDDVLISREDLIRLGAAEGEVVQLRSPNGAFTGRLRVAPIHPGNLEVHWPEGNVLLSGAAIDPDSMEPDYNALVTIERAC
jgi:anaerobic selenocysteine-containing dehydrogenase